MEHVEEAGVHSGDSRLRASRRYSLSAETIAVIEDAHPAHRRRARRRRACINVQYAVKDGQVFVIEANPRASRTVPFVAKATGVPLAKVAARVMVGATLAELRDEGLLRAAGRRRPRRGEGGGAAVQPLPRRRHACSGPEMRSTGEVMGIDRTFGLAFAKSQIAAGDRLPEQGTVFLSLADRDKARGLRRGPPLRRARASRIVATAGTADAARGARASRSTTVVAKVGEATGHGRGRPHLVGQGRPGGQHARGAAGPGPTAPTSARGRGAHGVPVPHHRGRRAGRRRRASPTGRSHELAVRSLQEYHRGRPAPARV